MEELLDILDSSVFTDEIKDKIKEEFDKAVEIGVQLELAKQDEENKEDEDKEDNQDEDGIELPNEPEYSGDEAVLNTISKREIVERAERFITKEIDRVTRAAEAYSKYISEELTDKGEKYGKFIEKQLSEKMDSYLDQLSNQIVESYAKENLELKTKIETAATLVEGFESMLKSGGVYLKDIMVESEKQQLKDNRPDIKIELDNVVVENNKLKQKVFDLEKNNLVNEATKDLTVAQKESIVKLSKHIKVNDTKSFESELRTICEGVISNKEPKQSSNVEKTMINENKKTKIEDTVGSHKRFF
jgi:hypothetical protein